MDLVEEQQFFFYFFVLTPTKSPRPSNFIKLKPSFPITQKLGEREREREREIILFYIYLLGSIEEEGGEWRIL